MQGNLILHSKKHSFPHGYGCISDFLPHLSKNTIFQKSRIWYQCHSCSKNWSQDQLPPCPIWSQWWYKLIRGFGETSTHTNFHKGFKSKTQHYFLVIFCYMAVNLRSEKNYQFEGQNTIFCLDQLLMTFIYQLDFFAPLCKEKGCHFV